MCILDIYPKIRKRWSFRLNSNGSVTGYVLLEIHEIYGRTPAVTENGFVVRLC